MRIIWVLGACLSSLSSVWAYEPAIRICGYSETWWQAHLSTRENDNILAREGARVLAREDLTLPELKFYLESDEWNALAAVEPFASVDVEKLVSDSQAYGYFIKTLTGRLPLLSRFLAAAEPKISSAKLDRHALGNFSMDENRRCILAQALSASELNGVIRFAGDADLWSRLSKGQRGAYFFQVLLKQSLQAFHGVSDEKEFLSTFAQALAPTSSLETVYRQFRASTHSEWRASDVHPLLKARNLDGAQGRRDVLDDWIYGFTPWIRAHDFGAASPKKFSTALYEHVLGRMKTDWSFYFQELDTVQREKLFERMARAFSDETVKWCALFLREGISADEFLNPYTINSFWRARPYMALQSLIIENSPAFAVLIKLK